MNDVVTEETLETPWRVDPPVRVYQDPFSTIDRYVAHFSHFKKEYYVSHKGIRAAILPIHEGRVLLVRQYRFLVNAVTLEVIGGKTDPEEPPALAAVRECLEETGYRCADPALLLFYQPGLDAYDNPTYVFTSHNVRQEVEVPAEHYRWVELSAVPSMLESGELGDSLSIIALSTFLLKQAAPVPARSQP